MRQVTVRLAPLLLAAAGCAHYQPLPVDAAGQAAEYRRRRLDDSALVADIAVWGGAPGPTEWTDRQLALAALRLRPELARARAVWRAARAGERAAGARPPPGAEASVERAVSAGDGESPWVVSLGALLTLELGGKRGARLQQARARTAVAEADLRLTAWGVLQEARAAALSVILVGVELADARAEAEALSRVEDLERERYAEAALTSAELARTSGEAQDARAGAAAAERRLLGARAALAAAIGLPPRGLTAVAVAVPTIAGCEAIDSLGVDSLEILALTRRPEIARVLGQYAGAEADLRLQVARQFPDLDLGPGFIWDQGVHRWTFGLALPSLLGFRNRGAIVEAEAARAAAAARVNEVQDSVLAQFGLALEACRGAGLERAAADSLVAVADRAVALARAAYDRGETSRLDVAVTELRRLRAGRAWRAADGRGLVAGLALEAAAGEWRGGTGAQWPDPRGERFQEEAPQ